MKKILKIMAPFIGCTSIGASVGVPCTFNNTTMTTMSATTTSEICSKGAAYNADNIRVKKVKTAYAWKRFNCKWEKNEIKTLDTTFDVDFNSREQEKHWTVTEYDIGSNENQLYKKYWLKQNTTADNNLRAILMQFEVDSKVPANSILTFESNLSIVGKLHINGHIFGILWGNPGCGSMEAEISDFTDSEELNITPGNIWTNEQIYATTKPGEFVRWKDPKKSGDKQMVMEYHSDSWSGTDVNFNLSKSQTIEIRNDSNKEKTIKKYFNVYLLTSAFSSGGGDHYVKDTDLFVKFTNPIVKTCEN